MRRRALLAIAASSLAGVAGCNESASEPTETGGGPATGTPTSSPLPTETQSETTSPKPTDSPTETAIEASQIDVELDPVGYYVRTFQPRPWRGIHPDDVVPADEIPSVLEDALRDALDGGYETDSVSEEFLAAIDEFRSAGGVTLDPYVRLDGTAYVFDPSVPTFVAELSNDEADDPDPERVVQDSAEFDSPAVETFVDTLTAGGPEIARAEYRASRVPDAVDAFLEEYDYVEDSRGVSRIETETVHADPPYTIEIRELTDEDWWGRPVVDGQDVDADLQRFLKTAVESDHRAPATWSPRYSVYLTDEVPASYFETVVPEGDARRVNYVRFDGTVYHVGAIESDHDSVPVAVSTEPVPPTSAGEPQFTLTVQATDGGADIDVPINSVTKISSYGGVPSALWVADGGQRRLLDSEAYDDELWEPAPDDPSVDERISDRVLEEVPIGTEISATYAVPDDLPDGTYVSRGVFGVRWRDYQTDRRRDGAVYPFRLTLTVGPS